MNAETRKYAKMVATYELFANGFPRLSAHLPRPPFPLPFPPFLPPLRPLHAPVCGYQLSKLRFWLSHSCYAGGRHWLAFQAAYPSQLLWTGRRRGVGPVICGFHVPGGFRGTALGSPTATAFAGGGGAGTSWTTDRPEVKI